MVHVLDVYSASVYFTNVKAEFTIGSQSSAVLGRVWSPRIDCQSHRGKNTLSTFVTQIPIFFIFGFVYLKYVILNSADFLVNSADFFACWFSFDITWLHLNSISLSKKLYNVITLKMFNYVQCSTKCSSSLQFSN